MARSKDFNEDTVLESAMRLFWQKGYSATSMKELEQVMRLKPTSIYNAFGNKRELFQKALQMYMNTVMAEFLDSVSNAETLQDALSNVLDGVVRLHFNKTYPGGCLIMLSIQESEQHDVRTKTMLDSSIHQLRDAIIKRFKQAQQIGEICTSHDSRVFANHVTALIAGMITMARSGFTRHELNKLVRSSADCLMQWYSR